MRFERKYNIGKTLSLAGLMMLTNACHKEYDVVIDWDWDKDIGLAPSKEVIQDEINKKNVNIVFINFNKMNATSLWPAAFHRARDTLQTRLDIAPGRIRGMGTIQVNSAVGAHLPDVTIDTIAGMALEDSLWFTANGWKVQRWQPSRNK